MSEPSNDDERSDAMVLFGASGDLAKKKLLPALYRLTARDMLDVPVIGVGRSAWDDDDFRRFARESIETIESDADPDLVESLLGHMTFVSGEYDDADLYPRIAEALGECEKPLCYMAIPPFLFDDVTHGLASAGLNERGRLVVEKPFGRDLESARELNDIVSKAYPEDRVFRIDHFLGKEPIQNLMVFRFANTIFEPIWNCRYVQQVQITMLEDFDVQGRGGFYDDVGTLRDVMQNHLLEMVALLAMEPPLSTDADSLRDEKVKVLKAIRAIDPADVIWGQYEGYRSEEGVEEDSDTETYVEVTLHIDSWRWAGVPFRIRAGKAMATTLTEALIEFRAPPRTLFDHQGDTEAHPNHLRFRMKPDDEVSLHVQAKTPSAEMSTAAVNLKVSSTEALGDAPEAYEQLLGDAMVGDMARFGRADAVLEQWRIVEPVLDGSQNPFIYRRGSWGPRVDRSFEWHDEEF